MLDTSRASLQELDPLEAEDTKTRMLWAILEEPYTARELASIVKVTEHEATRRAADLVAEGLADKGDIRENPHTGRKARVLICNAAGRRYMKTGIKPRPAVKRSALVKAVILAARNVEDPEGELKAALRALDSHDAGIVQRRLPAPYGDPRRLKAAQDGVWLRTSGDVILIRHMDEWHLRGAIHWLCRHGCPPDDEILAILQREEDRRQGEAS